MPKKKLSFEDALTRLEEVVAQMENGETPLEKAVALYKEGVQLSAYCDGELKAFEKEITTLQVGRDGAFVQKPLELKQTGGVKYDEPDEI